MNLTEVIKLFQSQIDKNTADEAGATDLFYISQSGEPRNTMIEIKRVPSGQLQTFLDKNEFVCLASNNMPVFKLKLTT